MKSFIFLLVMALVPQLLHAAAIDCGSNREAYVPKGISSPGDFAKIFGVTFQALQEVNKGLTEKNLRAEEMVCVPIKSDAYWVQLEKDKATWDKKIAELRGELKKSNDEIGDLKVRRDAAYIGWRLGVGALVVLAISLSIVGRNLYRRIHQDWRRRTLLAGPSSLQRIVHWISSLQIR